jgi:Protein of unknown function (DUF3631)
VNSAVPETGQLLNALELLLRRFVVLNDAQAAAVTLWTAHSWTIDAARATPYLYVTSAEPECGKTRLLEVLRELVREPLSTMNITDAAFFRAIDQLKPTLFLDEVDAFFSKKAQERGAKDELRSLLNAGYRRGERVYRMGGPNKTTLENFEVFGAKALAGLGSLPLTLASRCIRIELTRRRPDEPVEDFYPDELEEADHLHLALTSWAEQALEPLRAARPGRVDGLRDRVNEVWRPLLAIAELAGEPWASRARRAAVALTRGVGDDEASLGVLLLGDIRTVFEERQAERIATGDLIRALALFEESPWGEWWLDKDGEPLRSAPRRLAQKLRPYGIRSQKVRTSERAAWGYKHEDFLDAWERFLPARVVTEQTEQTQQLAPHGASDVPDVPDVPSGRDGRLGDEEAILREVAELVDEGVLVPRGEPELDLATAPLDVIRRAYEEAE